MMKRNGLRWMLWMALAAAMALGALDAPGFAASDVSVQGKLFFTGVVGENPSGGNRILLRWYSMEGQAPYEEFTLYRKAGDKNSPEPFVKLTRIKPIRNINTIRTLFEMPGSEAILADIIEILETLSGEMIGMDNYAEKLIQHLESQHPQGGSNLQNTTLANVNWGAALVMGLGYVDPVGSGLQTYELHAVEEDGTDALVLGRITIDADVVTVLPSPQTLTQVAIPGERGDRTIFLKWENSASLQDRLPLSFGFDIYRKIGAPGGGETFEGLLETGQLTKINEGPVLVKGPGEGSEPAEDYDFADTGQSVGLSGPEGMRLIPGETFTYWAVARDLFGQRGDPSNALTAVVPDQWPPAIPRGFRCDEDRTKSPAYSRLVWDRNEDDTVEYHVYRSRLFQHAGYKGPFDKVDGLTEGLIATVAQPVSGATVDLLDLDIDGVAHENMAFWYTVLAVDAWGNESGMSVPVRCVLFDTDAPSAPQPREVCTDVFECYSSSEIVTEEIRQLEAGREIELRFVRETPEIRRIRISRLVNDLPPEPIALLEYSDPEIKEVTYTDIPSLGRADVLSYEFDFYTASGRRPSCTGRLDDRVVAALRQYLSHYVPIRTTIRGQASKNRLCIRQNIPQRVPRDPTIGGIPNPLCFEFLPYEDAVGIILYRSENGADYYPIDDLRYPDGGGNLVICDEFNPNTPAEIQYGFKGFDENGNLSPLFRFQPLFLMPGRTPALIPVVKKVSSAGDVEHPAADVVWFGPKAGVASYIIRFGTPEASPAAPEEIFPDIEAPEPVYNEVYRPVSTLFHDDEHSLFSISLDNISDETATPIKLNQVYEVQVFARLYGGDRVPSSNVKKFVWSNIPVPDEPLDWPVRPLPPKSPVLIAQGYSEAAGGVFILLGQHYAMEGKNRVPLLDLVAYDLPFMIYRQRTDLPNQPYIQVSPLFEEINATGYTLNDPFFFHIYYAFGSGTYDAIYFIDNVGLVKDAKYRYQLLTLDATGELQAVFGPSAEVQAGLVPGKLEDPLVKK